MLSKPKPSFILRQKPSVLHTKTNKQKPYKDIYKDITNASIKLILHTKTVTNLVCSTFRCMKLDWYTLIYYGLFLYIDHTYAISVLLDFSMYEIGLVHINLLWPISLHRPHLCNFSASPTLEILFFFGRPTRLTTFGGKTVICTYSSLFFHSD